MSEKPRHPEKVNKPINPIKKKPDWIRSKIVDSQVFFQTKKVVNQNNLVTVCQEANCPNITECWSKKHATFMIMGDTCTRACAFCDVKTGKPTDLDILEPLKISNAVKDLNLKSLIRIKANYKQVGSDRLTNAVSLMNNKNNFIVLDFGTATTFDVLIKNTYFGGIIAPGVRLSLNTLSDKATLIPKIDLKKIKNVIGNDTISAVRSGFFWGYAGLIDNIINLIKKETRKSFKVVITGGFSNLFKNSIKTKVNHNKDITINGLIKISKLIK